MCTAAEPVVGVSVMLADPTLLARGSDPPEPPGGLRPDSSVTGPWLCWPGGATPRNPPVACGPIPPSPGRGPAGPGERPPGTPRGADGAWPASRQAPSRVLARGATPEPPMA